ncbi:hypothetical protein Q4512_13275 [Oceanihabitans sp. 2_MG-2023]|uniref:hypothetical protein n=1 Tax=Oceanihabitans sp. 2_MG-2023 TaxID=3062661 RepID=UPI0026E2865E|nr:hypothetical protein [Oceanihabitans sp. 2_MG-2023]MDO6597891.1 hypothetical protein [Oceanihabitans sp. 2_MG-2023]
MKKLIFIALFMSVTISFAQSSTTILPDGGGNNGSDIQNINGRSGFWINSTISSDLEGTFYLYNNWINRAEVHDVSGKGYNIPNCNFNVKFNRIEALLDNDKTGKVFAFNNRDLTKVKIGRKSFVKKSIDKGQSYLLEVVHEGKEIALFKAYSPTITTTRINPMTQQKMGKDKIDITSSYYVEKNGEIEAIKIKKSSVLKLMANKKEAVKSFIKENKLSVSEDADLFKIFQYYDTL